MRVLLIDNDPQASLTQGFWGPEATRRVARAESVAALYDPELAPIPEALVRPTGLDGVAIVPGSKHLTRANYDKIATGMTLAEVEQLLGGPGEAEGGDLAVAEGSGVAGVVGVGDFQSMSQPKSKLKTWEVLSPAESK